MRRSATPISEPSDQLVSGCSRARYCLVGADGVDQSCGVPLLGWNLKLEAPRFDPGPVLDPEADGAVLIITSRSGEEDLQSDAFPHQCEMARTRWIPQRCEKADRCWMTPLAIVRKAVVVANFQQPSSPLVLR